MDGYFSLYPLHVFRLVARNGSVSRAANELFISQPAVSRHIRTLEARLGATLFERTPGGMLLTPVGALLLERSNRLFAQLEEIPGIVGSASSEVSGAVEIAASSTPGAYLLPQLLKRFTDRFPACEPVLRVGDSAQVLTWLRDWIVPVGVVGSLTEAKGQGFLWQEIAHDELRLVSAPGLPLNTAERIGTEDVRRHTLFLREHGSSTRSGADRMLEGLVAAFHRVVEIASAEAIKEAVIAGLGVAVMSSWATRREEALQLLAPVRDPRARLSRPFYLVKRTDREITSAAAALWDDLAASCAENLEVD